MYRTLLVLECFVDFEFHAGKNYAPDVQMEFLCPLFKKAQVLIIP